MKTEAFLAGSQRNSTVLRCSGCEQGSRIPTDNGISANIPHFTKWAGVFSALVLLWGGEVQSGKLCDYCSTHGKYVYPIPSMYIAHFKKQKALILIK